MTEIQCQSKVKQYGLVQIQSWKKVVGTHISIQETVDPCGNPGYRWVLEFLYCRTAPVISLDQCLCPYLVLTIPVHAAILFASPAAKL